MNYYFFANALEKKSEHPLARAIFAKAEENGEAEQKSEITQFQAVPGNGLSGKLGEDWLYGGNFKFISDKNEDFCQHKRTGGTVGTARKDTAVLWKE